MRHDFNTPSTSPLPPSASRAACLTRTAILVDFTRPLARLEGRFSGLRWLRGAARAACSTRSAILAHFTFTRPFARLGLGDSASALTSVFGCERGGTLARGGCVARQRQRQRQRQQWTLATSTLATQYTSQGCSQSLGGRVSCSRQLAAGGDGKCTICIYNTLPAPTRHCTFKELNFEELEK
jgi:hypothetical protein